MLRFHDLRHSHVAALIEAKWDPYKIQLRLGHDSIQTTYDIYGHLFAHGKDDELSALDLVVQNKKDDAKSKNGNKEKAKVSAVEWRDALVRDEEE